VFRVIDNRIVVFAKDTGNVTVCLSIQRIEFRRTDARTGTENPVENQSQPATGDFNPATIRHHALPGI
jgi:hypothetical protein